MPTRRTTTAQRTRRASVLTPRDAAPLATTNAAGRSGDRIGVRKTYKLYIGGQFPRTESGRSYEVFDARGALLANACRGTRKDIREAVRAARKAQSGWAARTAFNRSQILYRIAELMEGRREQFIAEVMAAEGIGRRRAARLVDASIDRWVWYAGWADKFSQVIGTVNPVNGSYFNFSVPEPTGVVGRHRARGFEPPGPGQPPGPGDRLRQCGGRHRQRSRGRCRRSPSPRCWPRPTCPAGS